MKQNNGTLYSNMATVLKNNNKYDELLLQDIIKALYSETFAKLVLELERREFPGKSSICTQLATSGIFKQVINLYLIWNIKNSQASLQLIFNLECLEFFMLVINFECREFPGILYSAWNVGKSRRIINLNST